MQVEIDGVVLKEYRQLDSLVRLHYSLMLRPFGPRVRSVRFRLRSTGEPGERRRFVSDLTVRTRRGDVEVTISHPDPGVSVANAFNRAKRDVIRRLNSGPVTAPAPH